MGDSAAPTSPRLVQKWHREVLVVSCLVVLAAFLLQVLPNERVGFRGLARYPLPPSCASRTWLGVKCPGCGLTRAVVHLAHADWQASFRTHRLGWLLALVIAIQIPYRTHALLQPGHVLVGPRAARLAGLALVALLLGNWIVETLMDIARTH